MKFGKKKQKQPKYDRRVVMPRKNQVSIPKRNVSKKPSLFKKGSKTPKSVKRRSRDSSYIGKFFLVVLLIVIGIALLYISVKFILNTRNIGNEKDVKQEYVVGLEEIPVYPESEFIFKDSMSETSVANFIGTGNSAYRLPTSVDVDDIFAFYKDTLPNLGWNHVQSVEVGSEEMVDGEYWVNSQMGLRIYSKFRDIWYESITTEEAITGLRSRIERRIERDLLLTDKEFEDLLPDYPWVLKIPKQQLIAYSLSSFENLRTLQLREIGFDRTITITPVGNSNSAVYDTYLHEYAKDLGGSTDQEWVITNTILISTTNGAGLRGTLTSGSSNREVVVMNNSYNNVVYVFDSNSLENEFFNYVIENIQPQTFKKD